MVSQCQRKPAQIFNNRNLEKLFQDFQSVKFFLTPGPAAGSDRRALGGNQVQSSTCMATVKDEIRRMIEGLPDDATWEDLQCSIYVRERIEQGRAEVVQGKILEEIS